MFKKCKANCQANDNLYLRGNVFYYMVELPRQDGKRRYFIKSLHTKDYYEALERLKLMKDDSYSKTIEAKTLIFAAESISKTMAFDEYDEEVDCGGQVMMRKVKRISTQNDPIKIKALLEIYSKLQNLKSSISDPDTISRIQNLEKMMGQILTNQEVILQNQQKILQMDCINVGSGSGTPPKIHTIRELRDAWIQHENNGKAERRKKELFFEYIAEKIGLTLDSDYAEFNNTSKVNDIIHEIQTNPKWATDATRGKKIGYLKSLYDYVNDCYPGVYENLKNRYPVYKKGIPQNPHMPYSDMDLKEIFNPAHNHFKDNPDDFWVILMGMFAGARTNAAATIKYQDIVNIDGCFCIHFNKGDDKNKHLKTEATIRLLPIPQQLLDLGFIDWVQRKKKRLNAQDDDQIFTNAINSKGNYNNKYVSDQILPFVRSLNLSKPYKGKLDFHSFRNNASLQLQDILVPQSYINNIMGWKGQTIMEQHYSKHSLKKIKEQADKLRYDFLQSEFDYWRDVMSKK